MNQPSYQPIHDLQFNGLHWIEASAGTGKTYTLSSLMVRIFLSGYLPKQVVATTFTRAASAELKNRIRLRIQETVRYLEQHRGFDEYQLQDKIAQETDPLFQKVLSDHVGRMDFATNRLKIALDQVEELFVGTLDSFSQKLLREFSFESGKIERAEITDYAKSYSTQLIHDVLREWIQQQPQYIVDCLLLSQKLKDVNAYITLVEKSLNFSSAQFKEVAVPQLSTQNLEQILTELNALTESSMVEFASYVANNPKCFHSNYRPVLEGLNASLLALQKEIGQLGIGAYFSKMSTLYLNQIALLRLTKGGEPRKQNYLKVFTEDLRVSFEAMPVMQLALRLVEEKIAFEKQLDAIVLYLQYYVVQQVKQRLPQLLQQKGETTFAQQIRLLAEALEGEQGQRFAQVVHGRYPVILVDEFQDTNQDQDNMLAQIWRNPKWYAQGCMIMVGDPKQAIYGFRGGDMLTYNKARADIDTKNGHIYSLKYNHRSVSELVDGIDALFQRQIQFGENVKYHPVEAGRQHAPLFDAGQLNPSPLRWLKLHNEQDDAIQIAWKIQALLNQAQQKQLYIQADEYQPIQADDIAILAKNHNNLDRVQYELQRCGIRVNRASKRSVFDSFVAKDVGAVLTAIMHPHDETKVKRALLSRLLNLKLQQIIELEQQPEGLSQYMYDFDYIREMWLHKGFLTAWHYCLNLFQVWQNLVQFKSFDNERVVVNLRHLTEILSQHSEQYQGAQSLYAWYLRQLQAPSEREWEKERNLSNAQGVQLMSIHQSKGLEFKIVFLMGADSGFQDRESLNFSTQQIENPQTGQIETQRIIAVKNKTIQSTDEQTQHIQRLESEQHRLWYVALTRAKYRVYAVLAEGNSNKYNGVNFWLNQNGEAFQHPSSLDEMCLNERPERIYLAPTTAAQQFYVYDFPNRKFYPRSKTSFSALSQHLAPKQAHDALAAQLAMVGSAEDELLDVEQYVKPIQPLAWIKQHFPKGAEAGNFLHEIFEHIDFQNHQDWNLELHRRFSNDYPELWKTLKQEFKQHFVWIYQSLCAQLQDDYLAKAQQLLQEAQHRPVWLVKNSLIELNQHLNRQIQQHTDYLSLTQQWQHLFAQTSIEQAAVGLSVKKLANLQRQSSISSLLSDWNQEFTKLPPKKDIELNLAEFVSTSLERFVHDWLEEILMHLMQAWLRDILYTPLQGAFKLADLTQEQYLSEFPFYLSLADQILGIKQIHQLFKDEGQTILDLNPANSARYLTGSIDLVYYDGQRYHLADYKSNYLGQDQAHYQSAQLQISMSKASYWLQAGLYLVALHRYLKVSLQNYDIAQHLGGASYLYLRGMNGQLQQGYYVWKPTDTFILKLDALLGYAQTPQHHEVSHV